MQHSLWVWQPEDGLYEVSPISLGGSEVEISMSLTAVIQIKKYQSHKGTQAYLKMIYTNGREG